jgi:hypothetical protein
MDKEFIVKCNVSNNFIKNNIKQRALNASETSQMILSKMLKI